MSISYLVASIPRSEILIESHSFSNFDRSTSKLSTRSVGRHFICNSFKCSSTIFPSLTAGDSHTKIRVIFV